MEKSKFLFVCILLLTSSILSCCRQSGEHSIEQSTIDTIPELIRQIQQCSRLYTTEYQVHKIITANDLSGIKASGLGLNFNIQKPGYRKIIIPIEATLKGYIDFTQFSESSVTREGDRISITLPDPEVEMTASKINYENMKEFVSAYRSSFTAEERQTLVSQGRQSIINDIPHLGIEMNVRMSASNLLIPIIVNMGFEENNITINFRREFTPDILKRKVE